MEDPKAQKRMQVILEHLGGRLNATEAAQALGISRKTFYEWLDRAREAICLAMSDRPTGRPRTPGDAEKDRLMQELEALEQERTVLAARLRIQEAIRQTVEDMAARASKKKDRGP